MDRVESLRLFLRVAETGSFSRAARAEKLGQPAVSKAVAALEGAWGTRLFTRTTRRVALTEAGRRALARARAWIDAHDALDAEMRGADRDPVGLLRVSSSIAFTRAELAPHAPAFLKQYPNIKIDFATRDDRVDLIADGIDIAFRLGALADSNLTAKKLGAYRRIVVAAADAPIRKPRQLEDLRMLPCVLFSTGARPDRWSLRAGRQQRDIEVSGRVTVTTGRLALDFVRMGQGLALLPTFLVRRDLEEGRLVHVLRDWAGAPLDLHAVWATGRDLPRSARLSRLHRPAVESGRVTVIPQRPSPARRPRSPLRGTSRSSPPCPSPSLPVGRRGRARLA